MSRPCRSAGGMIKWFYILSAISGHVFSFAQNVQVDSVDANVTYTNLTDLDFDPNLNGTKDIGQPLLPERRFRFKLDVKPGPVQSVPLGQLSHHLISLINAFWIREDNVPITEQSTYRDEDFPDILTQIDASDNSNMMTPVTLARGFVIIAQAVFFREESHAMNFDWNFRSKRRGTTQTFLYRGPNNPPVDVGSTNASRSVSLLNSNDVTNVENTLGNAGSGDNSSNAADVRTRFTGTSMPSSRFLILLINLFERFWELRAQEPTYTFGVEHPLLLLQYPHEPWWLSYRHWTFEKPDGGEITWQDLTYRLLRMLQLPAYVNRWETLTSDLYIGERKIGTVTFYKDTGVPTS